MKLFFTSLNTKILTTATVYFTTTLDFTSKIQVHIKYIFKMIFFNYFSFTIFTSRKINICITPLKIFKTPLLIITSSQGVLL